MKKIAGISILGLLVAAIFTIFIIRVSLKEKKDLNIPDPEKALKEAEIMVLDGPAMPEALPVEETGNNGYWWIKQDDNKKLLYVESLIEKFGLGDKKLMPAKIVERLDIFYKPKDNPLDIKMGISIERGFNDIARGMTK